jgi:gliding motility-associated-like protein
MMRKTRIIYVLCLYCLFGQAQVNLNFETGDFTGWTGRVGNTSTGGQMLAVGSPTIWTMGMNTSIWNQSYHTITNGSATDQFGVFPVVAPGGSFSARLGGAGPNVNNGGGCGGSPTNYICPKQPGYVGPTVPPFSGAESLEQSFVVTNANCIISLQYAAVFNNGNHSGAGATVNPFFKAEVLNSSGTSISSCLNYTFVLNKSSLPPGAYQSGSTPCYYPSTSASSVVVCMPWQRKMFDLTAQIGQTITVKFTAGGCDEGGHFGYAYIDASAGPKDLIQSGAVGCTGPKILTGPTQYGSNYTWAGPGTMTTSVNSATVNTTGTYTLTVSTGTPAVCPITFTTYVNLTNPSITAVSNSQSVCSGGSITGINFSPSPSGASIDWSNTNTSVGLASLGTGSITGYNSPTVTAQQIAVITATPSFGGCVGPAKTFTVIVNPYPNLVVSASPTINCTSPTAVLSGTSTTPGVTYVWSPGGSTPTGSTTTVSNAGTYTLTSSFGTCTTASVVTVSTNTTLPNANANASNTITCLTNTTTLNGSSSTSGATYSWTPGGSSPTNSTTIVSAAGNYTLSVTDPVNGCKTTTVVSVSQNTTVPTVTSASGGVLNCTLTTVNASASTTTSPVSYAWSGSGITSATNISTITVNQPGTYNYTVTNITNGCFTSGSQAITQNTATPVITATNTNTLTCTTLTASVIGTGGGAYSWSGTNITGGATTATATVNQPGTYTLLVTAANGCTAVATTSVTQNTTAPTASASNTSTLTCTTNTASITGTGGGNYVWSGPGIVSGATTDNPVVNQSGTYIVTVTATNGCTATANTTITQNTVTPIVSSSVLNTLTCITTTVNAVATTTTSPVAYNWSGSGITSAVNISTITVNQSGVYGYTVTDNTTGCKTTGTVSVTQNTLAPTVSTATSGVLNCTLTSVNASATTTTSPVSYTWSGSGITSATNTSTISANQPGTFNFTVTNTNNGCSTIGSQTISQNTVVPTSTLTPSSLTTTCASPTATLLVTSSADPNSVYTWTVPAGGSLSNTSSNNPVASGSGIFTVAVTNTLNGCVSAVETVTITGDANSPVLNAASSNSVICSGSATTLSASGADSYTWSAEAGSVISSTAVVSPTTTTTYSVIGTNTLTGCSNVTNITIIANTTPTIGISTTANSICIGDNATINLTGATTYTVTNPLVVTTNSLIVTPTTLTTYTIIGETANCTSSTETISINVNSLPLLNPTTSSALICSNASATLSITGADTYTWSTTENTNTVTVSPITITTYTVSGTNTLTGCSNMTNITVNVATTPTVNITATLFTICEGNSTTLTLTGASNYTVTNPSQTTSGTVTLNPIAQTTYTIVGETSNCTSATETITIDVNALPQLAVSDATTCAGTAVTLTASGADTYTWSTTDNTNSTSVTPTINTTYSVTGTNTLTGCTSTLTIADVTVNQVPVIIASANPNTTCTTGTVTLNASNTNTTAITNYTWTLGNGVDNTNQNQGSINFPANGLTTGTYTYMVIATDANGCVSPQSTATLNIIDIPNVNFDLSDLNICQNETGIISINTPQAGVNYDWNINGQTITNSNPLTVPNTITNTVGIYTVNVIAGIGTCTNTAFNSFTVNALPTVALVNSNVSACENTTAQLDVAGPNSTYNYNWTNGSNTAIGPNLNVNPLTQATAGNYTVTATDANGCLNRTIGAIDAQVCQTYIPEIFTPNGDGKNDGFVIKNIENYPDNKLKIFNRWGNMIYEKDSYLNEFEGYANTGDQVGKSKLPAGTYYVILEYGDQKTETYNGFLLLQY